MCSHGSCAQSEERIKGHGPHVTRTVRRVERTEWCAPPTITTSGGGGWSLVSSASATLTLPDAAAARVGRQP